MVLRENSFFFLQICGKFLYFKKYLFSAGEMAQQLKCLPLKREDLRLKTQFDANCSSGAYNPRISIVRWDGDRRTPWTFGTW